MSVLDKAGVTQRQRTAQCNFLVQACGGECHGVVHLDSSTGRAGSRRGANRLIEKRSIATTGFTQKSSRQSVWLLREAEVDGVVDIRQNHTSQLAGFAKRDDLALILETQSIGYLEEQRLAPPPDLLRRCHAGLPWSEYGTAFEVMVAERLLRKILRGIETRFARPYRRCAEPTPEHCHRRLVAEAFARLEPGLEIHHLTLKSAREKTLGSDGVY
jgi:hypothetical protein